MRFPRQEYWSGLPCPPPGELPDPGIEPTSLMSPALAGEFFTSHAVFKSQKYHTKMCDMHCSKPAKHHTLFLFDQVHLKPSFFPEQYLSTLDTEL